jgi:hypothetical protein
VEPDAELVPAEWLELAATMNAELADEGDAEQL